MNYVACWYLWEYVATWLALDMENHGRWYELMSFGRFGDVFTMDLGYRIVSYCCINIILYIVDLSIEFTMKGLYFP